MRDISSSVQNTDEDRLMHVNDAMEPIEFITSWEEQPSEIWGTQESHKQSEDLHAHFVTFETPFNLASMTLPSK